MKVLGNLLWLLFGGLECAIAYFAGTAVLFISIIGIPAGLQTAKLGLLSLWPFGAEVRQTSYPQGCLALFLNFLWLITGGLVACLLHVVFGVLLCITIIGIPFGLQHFKMAGLALAPFGKEIEVKL